VALVRFQTSAGAMRVSGIGSSDRALAADQKGQHVLADRVFGVLLAGAVART
jgi:hypothetical protein